MRVGLLHQCTSIWCTVGALVLAFLCWLPGLQLSAQQCGCSDGSVRLCFAVGAFCTVSGLLPPVAAACSSFAALRICSLLDSSSESYGVLYVFECLYNVSQSSAQHLSTCRTIFSWFWRVFQVCMALAWAATSRRSCGATSPICKHHMCSCRVGKCHFDLAGLCWVSALPVQEQQMAACCSSLVTRAVLYAAQTQHCMSASVRDSYAAVAGCTQPMRQVDANARCWRTCSLTCQSASLDSGALIAWASTFYQPLRHHPAKWQCLRCACCTCASTLPGCNGCLSPWRAAPCSNLAKIHAGSHTIPEGSQAV